MKAVVVELNNGFAAVLSDDGCIVTVKNNNFKIGQIIKTRNPNFKIARKIAAFSASAAAFIILSVGTWAYASPYTYISVDVNPSIEFTANRFDLIIRVKAVNDDGENILSEIPLTNLKNKTIRNAISQTIEQITEAGYFDSDTEGGIVIATSCKDTEKADNLVLELRETLENETAQNGDKVTIETFSVGLERVEEAKEMGVTPGKLNLVEKLQGVADDPSSINTEEWLDKPVREIMKATKEYKDHKNNSVKSSDETITKDSDEMIADDAGETIADVASEPIADDSDKIIVDDFDETTAQKEQVQQENQLKQSKEEHALEKAEKKSEKDQNVVDKSNIKEQATEKKGAEKAKKVNEKSSKAEESSTEEDAYPSDDASSLTLKETEKSKATEKMEETSEKTHKETNKGQEKENTSNQSENQGNH